MVKVIRGHDGAFHNLGYFTFLAAVGSMHHRCGSIVLAFVLTAWGCSKGVYPVEGTLQWPDGTPAKELAGSLVEFEKVEPPAVSARAEVKPDGTFSLASPGLGAGAVVGNYRVLVVAALPNDRDAVPPPPIDPKYQRFETSELTFKVEPSKNMPVFKLQRNPHSRRRTGG